MIIKKKFRILLALIALFFCLSSIEKTYAKYITSASGDASVTISRWNIKLNDFDITNGSNFSNSIVPTFNGNEYTSKDIIAPGIEGVFDITIDGTETDTAYSLNIGINPSSKSDVSDLIITKYTVDDDDTEYNYEGELKDTFALNDKKIITYHIYIKWNDDETTEEMSNKDDTEAAYNNGIALMDVNVKITQLAN